MKVEYNFKSQSAKDAKKMNYGNESYWQYLDNSAIESSEYYRSIGDYKKAKEMLTRSLTEALQGNEGE
jgi:hypothetical protein